MSQLTSYIAFWIILFILLGAFWYVMDRRFGVKWYRRWFNLTHRDPLPAGVEAGFIYNRKSRHKAVMATLLSTVQTVAALFTLESINLLVELILWIVEVPMTMLGFMIGPWAYRLWKGRDEVFDKLDEFHVKTRLEEKDEKSEAKAEKPKTEPESPRVSEPAEPVQEKQPEEKPEPPSPEPKKDDDDDGPDDPRDMLRRYTDKH